MDSDLLKPRFRLLICCNFMFRDVSKNLPVLLLKFTCFTNQQKKPPFSKGCEYKLLHMPAGNPKTTLKIIHQVFDPGLAAASLP